MDVIDHDTDETTQAILDITNEFIDKYTLEGYSVSYKMEFKRKLAGLCIAYYNQGIDDCIEKILKEKNGD